MTLDRLDDRLTPTDVGGVSGSLTPPLVGVTAYPLPVGELSPFVRDITLPDGSVIQVDTRTNGDLAPLTPFVRTAKGPNGSVVLVDARADGDLTVSRITSDGSYDTSFSGDGKAEIRLPDVAEFRSSSQLQMDASAVRVAVGADGAVVLAVTAVGGAGQSPLALVRLTPAGQLDTAFDGDGVRLLNDILPLNPSGFLPSQLDGLAVDGDGDILGYAAATSVPAVITDFNAPFPAPTLVPGQLFRLTPTGQRDATFGTQGKTELPGNNGSVLVGTNRILSMPDGGTLVISGQSRENDFYGDGSFSFTFYDAKVTRYDAAGKLDLSYGRNGTQIIRSGEQRTITTIAADPLADGGVLLTLVDQGYFGPDSTASVARLTKTGQLDTAFGGGDGLVTVPSKYLGQLGGSTVRPDGSSVLVFKNTAVEGDRIGVELLGLTPTGAIDTSFAVNGTGFVAVAGRTAMEQGVDFEQVLTIGDDRIAVPSVVDGMVTPGQSVRIATIDLKSPVLASPLPAVSKAVLQSLAESKRITVFGFVDIFPGEANTKVNTLVADMNGDGTNDTVYSTGDGNRPLVRIIDGRTQQDFLPAALVYENTFRGGVLIDAIDVTGDGISELVTSPGLGGGARIQVFDVSTGKLQMVNNFFAIEDVNFRGGARIATGDVDGNGKQDLIVGAGDGGGPRVAVYSGDGLARMGNPPKLLNDFFAFGGSDVVNLRNGVFVAAGDLDGDGKADLIFGGGPGGGPRVMAVSGDDLFRGGPTQAMAKPLANFFAGDETLRDGVELKTRFVTDTQIELIATPINGDGPMSFRLPAAE